MTVDINQRRQNKTWMTLAIVVFMLISIEVALQVRAYLRFGSNAFMKVVEQSRYSFHPVTGIKLLKPNAVFEGSSIKIETNEYGLRSANLASAKGTDEIRIAVVGASSVLGDYSPTNRETLPSQLEVKLRNSLDKSNINVINAGMGGYGLREQRLMIEHILEPLGIDLLVLYPGLGNVSSYCRSSDRSDSEDFRLGQLHAPGWALTIQLLTKNTVWLRSTKARRTDLVDIDKLDTSPYEARLSELMAAVRKFELPMLVVTNARSFKKDMPLEQQMKLSETARYFNSCFDLEGLYQVNELHNRLLMEAASVNGFRIYRLDETMPGGKKYFGDSSHFTAAGTEYAAELLLPEVQSYVYQLAREGSLEKPEIWN